MQCLQLIVPSVYPADTEVCSGLCGRCLVPAVEVKVLRTDSEEEVSYLVRLDEGFDVWWREMSMLAFSRILSTEL